MIDQSLRFTALIALYCIPDLRLFIQSLCLSGIMTFIVSGISTFRANGMHPILFVDVLPGLSVGF